MSGRLHAYSHSIAEFPGLDKRLLCGDDALSALSFSDVVSNSLGVGKMHKITIMSKPGCHLCEAAVQTVQKGGGQHIACLIEEIDITQDQELLDKYHDEIPVVLVDNVEKFRHVVD